MGHLYKILDLISKYEELDENLEKDKNEIEIESEKTNRYALVRNKVITHIMTHHHYDSISDNKRTCDRYERRK